MGTSDSAIVAVSRPLTDTKRGWNSIETVSEHICFLGKELSPALIRKRAPFFEFDYIYEVYS